MKKFISILILMTTMFSTAYANGIRSTISNIIEDSKISKNAISISIKNADTGKTVYHLNDKKLTPPASVQKAITIIPIAETLGTEYELSTKLYARGKNSYVIKLGADPYLSFKDLKNLVSKINKENVTKIYIDDSITEKKDWGEGWQWDDDLNPLMPRFNSYNLDNNLVKVTIVPTTEGQQAAIINPSKYPYAFYNNIITGKENNVKVERDYDYHFNKIILTGTINSSYTITIPNNNLRRYFYIRLKEALAENGIYLKEPFTTTTLQNSDVFISEVKHPLSDSISDILKNSNNMAIESLSKIAAAEKYKKTGTDSDAVRLFEEYCAKMGIDCSEIKIVDASGVSKNNLLNADFISEYLIKNKANALYEKLPHSGEGTLANRMIPLKDNLNAKTGTLSDISSIAGFLTTKRGNHYVFCIMINDPASTSSAKKVLEDYIIRKMYLDM